MSVTGRLYCVAVLRLDVWAERSGFVGYSMGLQDHQSQSFEIRNHPDSSGSSSRGLDCTKGSRILGGVRIVFGVDV